jgi:hypothetical protein
MTLDKSIGINYRAFFEDSQEGPPMLPEGFNKAWPGIYRLHKELRELIIEIWNIRHNIQKTARIEQISYLNKGLSYRAAFNISLVREVRVTRDRLVEPLARARRRWEKLDLQIDIAQAYCETELDEYIGQEMVRTLDEEVRGSSLVKLFQLLKLSSGLAQLDLSP